METLPQVAESIARYQVQSSDVLSDMRINVSEQGADSVIWYKERFLADEEIIEHIVENATSTIHWTIHRPKRGWYLRIRSPSFPPGVFINVTPLPQTSAYHTDAALTLACRTSKAELYPGGSNAAASGSKRSLDSDITLTDASRDSSTHAYPPTPPQQGSPSAQVLSPRAVEAKLEQIPQASSPRPRPVSQLVAGQITHFLLTPHSLPHVPHQTETVSIFSRVISAFKNNAPSHSSSFTMSPIPPPTAPPPADLNHTPYTPRPIVTFHDRTPVWTVRSTNGVLEIDSAQVKSLGVDITFYVACALTYLEYLSEREGYLAAEADY